MKRFAFAFVLTAVMTGSFAQAQTDDMVAACGRLTQEMQVAQQQRSDLEKRLNEINESQTTSLGDLRLIQADIAYLDEMIADINQDMNKVCH